MRNCFKRIQNFFLIIIKLHNFLWLSSSSGLRRDNQTNFLWLEANFVAVWALNSCRVESLKWLNSESSFSMAHFTRCCSIKMSDRLLDCFVSTHHLHRKVGGQQIHFTSLITAPKLKLLINKFLSLPTDSNQKKNKQLRSVKIFWIISSAPIFFDSKQIMEQCEQVL